MTPTRLGHRVGPEARLVAGVFVLALLARWVVLWVAIRRDQVLGYDPATYYVAGAALLHGRMPYHGDFVLVHPPVIALVALPFALLGWATSAHVGFVAAGMACGVLGAASAAGVSRLALVWGASRAAAVAGGAFLALWTTPVSAQAVLRLEPVGDVLLVTALLALGASQPGGRRRLVVAGVAFGLLANVKIWWFVVVPVVLVLRWLRHRQGREAGVVLLAAALTAVVVDLPFLAVARGRMFHSVITAQLERPSVQGLPSGVVERMPALPRLDQITGLASLASQFEDQAAVYDDTRVHALTILVCLGFLVMAVLAWGTPLGRFCVPLAALQLAVLLAVPIFYDFYGDFAAVAVALVLAAGVDRLSGTRVTSVAVASAWSAVALLPLLVAVSHDGLLRGELGLPDTRPAAAYLARPGCVVADGARGLIALDVVDRSLARGCRNFVDVQGVGHGAGPDPRARLVGGRANRAWRRELSAYLRSGHTLVLGDPVIRYLLGPQRTAAIVRGRPHVTVGGTVYVFAPR